MKKYYVDKIGRYNGEHEVHVEECRCRPSEENCIYLGEFYSCRPAVEEAKKHFFRINGCYGCCKECHK